MNAASVCCVDTAWSGENGVSHAPHAARRACVVLRLSGETNLLATASESWTPARPLAGEDHESYW